MESFLVVSGIVAGSAVIGCATRTIRADDKSRGVGSRWKPGIKDQITGQDMKAARQWAVFFEIIPPH
jgi:hypothetical protein